jgi:hypothetical protein
MEKSITVTLSINEVAEAIRYYLTNDCGVKGLEDATTADLLYTEGRFKASFHIEKGVYE